MATAKIPFFLEGLDGRLINVTLVQSVIVDPEDDTDVLWLFRNGEIYREDLQNAEDALNRQTSVKNLLLGEYSKLVQDLTNAEQRIVEQNETINKQTEIIEEKEEIIDNTSERLDSINGEVV